jgi:hypothetical protein
MSRIKYPEAGTPVAVYWEDIQEDVVGDPDLAETAERISYGIYMGRKRKGKRWFIVTSTTLEGWESRKYGGQSGWCSYPVGAVVKVVPLVDPEAPEPEEEEEQKPPEKEPEKP